MSDEALKILLNNYLVSRSPEDAIAFAESYARHGIVDSVLIWVVDIQEGYEEGYHTSLHLTKLGATIAAADWILERIEHDIIDTNEMEDPEAASNLEELKRKLEAAIKQKDADALDTLIDNYNEDLPRGTVIQVGRQMVSQ
jgi:hypothetical protein